jgi:hypothetical protein
MTLEDSDLLHTVSTAAGADSFPVPSDMQGVTDLEQPLGVENILDISDSSMPLVDKPADRNSDIESEEEVIVRPRLVKTRTTVEVCSTAVLV